MTTLLYPTPAGFQPPSSSHRLRTNNKVRGLLAEASRIADQINQALYTCKPEERPTIHSPADAANIFAPFLKSLDHEEMWVALTNTRNGLIALVKVYSGSVNSAQIRACELFRQAIIQSATSIVLAHNHPSGDPTPSPDDVAVTRALVQAGKLLEIEVLDHLVIGQDSRFVSLKERGLGFS